MTRALGQNRRGVVVVVRRGVRLAMLERHERRHGPVKRAGERESGGGAGGQPRASLHGQLGSGRRGRPAPEFPGGSADEHVITGRVQHPVVAFSRIVVVARDLDEALVEAQVVSDGVLPALPVFSVVREVAHDELIDAVEGEPSLRTLADGHHDKRVITERRLVGFTLLLLSISSFTLWLSNYLFFIRSGRYVVPLSNRCVFSVICLIGARRRLRGAGSRCFWRGGSVGPRALVSEQ